MQVGGCQTSLTSTVCTIQEATQFTHSYRVEVVLVDVKLTVAVVLTSLVLFSYLVCVR